MKNKVTKREYERWTSRSGKVVTYKKGEKKKKPPPPKPWQIGQQDKWLWK